MHKTTALALLPTIIPIAVAFTIPSWDKLQSKPSPLHSPLQITPPIYRDQLPAHVSQSPNQLPILYRDKQCVDVASQIIWLALECKNVDYITVLCDTNNDNIVPRIIWPDEPSLTTTDPTQALEQIHSRYPNPIPFYPKISVAVDASRSNILRLPGVMPRNSDETFLSSSPFLFRTSTNDINEKDNLLVAKSSHCVSLEELEEMMEEYEGPYLCGKDMTAADLVWITYLERYSVQLPLLFPKIEVLNPRSSAYELVANWIKTMENLPSYACAVMGDGRHWRRCLEQSVKVHNSHCKQQVVMSPAPKRKRWWLKRNGSSNNDKKLWTCYCYDAEGNRIRPWLAESPQHEAGLYLFRSRESIIDDFLAKTNDSTATKEKADESLRFIISQLIDWTDDETQNDILLPYNASDILEFVIDRVEIPKDLGMLPASALGNLLKKFEENEILQHTQGSKIERI